MSACSQVERVREADTLLFCQRFRFSTSYPIDVRVLSLSVSTAVADTYFMPQSPEVTFLVTPPSAGGWKAPVHPHIYSNG